MTLPERTSTHSVTLDLCNQCLDGVGGECHAPGCALWMRIRDKVATGSRERTVEFDPLVELRDALDDAIHREYTTGWRFLGGPVTPGEVLQDPAQMRNLARIQAAAWDVVRRRVEGVTDAAG